MDQAIFLVEVVEEGETAAGVTEGSQVFDEGDLHFRAGHQHARMPGKLILALEEADLGLEVGVGAGIAEGRVQSIVQRNGNRQRGRSETNAEEIMELLLGGTLEAGRLLGRLCSRHGRRRRRPLLVNFRFSENRLHWYEVKD